MYANQEEIDAWLHHHRDTLKHECVISSMPGPVHNLLPTSVPRGKCYLDLVTKEFIPILE